MITISFGWVFVTSGQKKKNSHLLLDVQPIPSQQIADANHYVTQRGLLSSSTDIDNFSKHDRQVIGERYKKDSAAVKSTSSQRSGEKKDNQKEKVTSRPHQSSGRQMEDLLAIRLSLREGFHR